MRCKISAIIWLCCFLAGPGWALQNQLKDHPSPYLAMHGDDPVAWQDWSEDTLALARKQDKLLFVSSGYFSCHWCHVMQRESYRNPQIAALLNEHFIPVKIDRELHPALDAYLIDYLERTRGQAGWPLNIFLTPEGYPLIGTTYLPPDRFAMLLRRLDETWQKKRDESRDLARRALLQVIAEKRKAPFKPAPFTDLAQGFFRQALLVGDPLEGGFGEQSKFPMSPQLLGMLQLRGDQPFPALDQVLHATLDQMAQQGLRDQLAGGFFRYTVDPSWQIPHFEKMLYTQAQLVRVYLLAGRLYQRDDYLEVARDTLNFVLSRMKGDDGLLIAAFSAVNEQGEEGGAYLWHADQLGALLGEQDAALARSHWGMVGTSPLDGGYLPHQGATAAQLAEQSGIPVEQMRNRLATIRDKLLSARSQRSLPADTKELAGWNGLMIGSLAQGAAQLDESRYADAALKLARRLKQRLWHKDELWRARDGERPLGLAGLADYAYVADGIDRLLRVRPDPELAAWRDQLLRQAWRRFHTGSGWRASERRLIPGMGETPAEKDGALLSPSGVLLAVTLRNTDSDLKEEAVTARAASWRPVQEAPFWYPTHLMALRGKAGNWP